MQDILVEDRGRRRHGADRSRIGNRDRPRLHQKTHARQGVGRRVGRVAAMRLGLFIPVAACAAVLTLPAQAQRRMPAENAAPAGGLRTADTTIVINKAMLPPAWALAERQL